MNQIERRIQITIAERTIDSLNRQLFHLKKRERQLVDTLLDKRTEPDIRAGAQFDLDKITLRITTAEDHRAQQHRLIDELDAEAARQATIKVISESGDRAQIAITYELDNGKKLSYTRHVSWNGASYVGHSTLTNKPVVYRLPGSAQQEAA